MATRKIIRIDEDKCTGCGLCVTSCAEGALQIIDGKAKLVNEVFCDGLGACIGDCPEDALHIEERNAPDFDEAAVHAHLKSPASPLRAAPAPVHAKPAPAPATASAPAHQPHFGGCPGSALGSFGGDAHARPAERPADPTGAAAPSALRHWPVQLMLVPPHAPFLKGADLLIAADCVPFAFPDFHRSYLTGRSVVVGCPKLDDLDHYREKLGAIFAEARPRSVTVLKMEVPCCGGIAHAAMVARDAASPALPIEVHTIGVQGQILRKETLPGKAAQGA
jgi:Pyruvate/2-oxoacid:ferredoxin oxidoreductase delta subunit